MTRETIKEYILQVKSQDGTEALYNRWEPDILVEVINEIFNDHEEQLKAKDEEIERLEDQLSSVHNIMYRNGYSDAIDCYDTFGNFNTRHKPNAKARSIIAMLFWTMKGQKAICAKSFNDFGVNNHNTSFYKGAYENSKMWFKQTHKMLKDQR